jgi:prolyl 4-hydroxylase
MSDQQQAQVLLNANRPLEALPYLRRAADAGNAGAAVEAARVLLFLLESESGFTEAVALLARAETLAHPAASYWLAWIALGGRLLERNFARIDAWIRRSAAGGFVPALRALAMLSARSNNEQAQHEANALFHALAMRGDKLSQELLTERMRTRDGGAGDSTSQHVPASPSQDAMSPLSPNGFESLLRLPEPYTLALQPRVEWADTLLSADECRYVIAIARPWLRRSQAYDPHGTSTRLDEIRTSSDAPIDPLCEDFYVRLLQLRLAHAAHSELIQGEHLTVLHYLPGEQYRPHRDYLPPSALAERRPQAGQRLRTACVYLNVPSAGGETDFPQLGVRIAPKLGSAVIFDNLGDNGEPEPASLHAGLPVLAGEKWLATLWIRQAPFRSF